MKLRMSATLLTGCVLVTSNAVNAQTNAGDVTLRVPLNLTRLSPEIAKVVVSCKLESAAIGDQNGQPITGRLVVLDAKQEIAVTGGQVVTTASVVFSIPSLVNPSAYQAIYGCRLTGITKAGRSDGFSAITPDPVFRLVPTPANFEGTFAW